MNIRHGHSDERDGYNIYYRRWQALSSLRHIIIGHTGER